MTAADYNRATKRLLISLLAIYLLCELVARYGLPHMSRIQARIRDEKRALLSERQNGAPKSVVFVGNSLLLWSLDVPLLNRLSSGDFRYSRLVIENTQYWDWYFGLRRMLAEGARPDVVAVLIGANHWLEDSVEGEYFAHALLRPTDTLLLRQQLNLDRTTASSYFFASLSAWLGSRAIIRKNFLRLLFPDVEQFTRKLITLPSYPEGDRAKVAATQRLHDLKSLCESFGVRLVVVLHPTLDRRAPFDALRTAAGLAGVELIAPVHLEYPESFYSDGYHLNATGMERFSRDLLPALELRLRASRAAQA